MKNVKQVSLIGIMLLIISAWFMVSADIRRENHSLKKDNLWIEQPDPGGTYYAIAEHPVDYTWNMVGCGETAFAATWRLLMVDLSDTTNFPHANTNGVIFDSIRYSTVSSVSKRWNVRLGVVTQTGSTNGDVDWFYFYSWSALSVINSLYDLSRPVNTLLSGSTPVFFKTTNVTDDSTAYDNDDAWTTILGGSTMLGVGDIVLEMIEVEDAATITLYDLKIEYRTE